jgi:hypothetical protein
MNPCNVIATVLLCSLVGSNVTDTTNLYMSLGAKWLQRRKREEMAIQLIMNIFLYFIYFFINADPKI